MMPIIALSSTEAELYSAVLTAMDMIFVYHIVTSMRLTVELPIVLYLDKSAAIALANNWSIGGRTKHTYTKKLFTRVEGTWISYSEVPKRKELVVDVGTKNLPTKEFWKCTSNFMS